jgi:perosamine synthetase
MIPLFKVFMNKDLTGVLDTLNSGYIGEGARAKELENRIRAEFGNDTIRLVNSATSAIDIALHMIGIEYGDEIITTPITCTATNSNAVNRGAKLVWADVDPFTGLINPLDVFKKITPRTKAIIAVNWGGRMPDYAALKAYGIPVIEDAAHGPYWSNQERGDYIVWSFQAIKHLTTGDGGALASPDHDRARLLRWYGLDRESNADFRCAQDIQEVGYKYHMNDIAASIGLANLGNLRYNVSLHNKNAEYFTRNINNPHIRLPEYHADHPFWLYTVWTEYRDELIEHLRVNGIASSQVHARNDKHAAFIKASKFGRTVHNGSLPGTDIFDTHQLSIPVGWWLDIHDLHTIVDTLNIFKI